jgi:hypothetical protein
MRRNNYSAFLEKSFWKSFLDGRSLIFFRIDRKPENRELPSYELPAPSCSLSAAGKFYGSSSGREFARTDLAVAQPCHHETSRRSEAGS